MTQANPKLRTFQDFLAYGDSSDRRYALLNSGDLIELPPESELNSWIAKLLGMVLEQIVSLSRNDLQRRSADHFSRFSNPKVNGNRAFGVLTMHPE